MRLFLALVTWYVLTTACSVSLVLSHELARGGTAGITGGFAGGERGLQQLVEQGEIKLAEPGKSAYLTLPNAVLPETPLGTASARSACKGRPHHHVRNAVAGCI